MGLVSLSNFICLKVYYWKIAQYTHAIYTCNLSKFTFFWLYSTISPQTIYAANTVPDNLTCSENVAYDTVGNILQMSTQANMTWSENIAYATTVNTTKQDSSEDTSTSLTVVYDEVAPKNNWQFIHYM